MIRALPFVRLAAAMVVIVVLSAAPAAAGFDARTWRFRKPIAVPASAARYAEVPLDGETYARAARSLDDLRVVTANGEEIPYVVRRWPASETMGTVSNPILNLSIQPGRLTRFELRTLGPGRRHNQLAITVGDPEFLPRAVTVEGSDDRQTWFVLARGEIYRFPAGATVDTIGYPQSVYRFVRVTIHDNDRPALRVGDAALRFRQVVPAREDRWFAGVVESVVDPQARTTRVAIDTGFARLPLSRLAVAVSEPPAFVRQAEVEVSEDGITWQPEARTTLVRTTQTPSERAAVIPLEEVRARYVRLTIQNGDNPPLRVVRASVYGIRRTVLFPLSAGRTYLLYFGGPADAPQYDLPEVLSREGGAPRTIEASLGALQPNPAYIPPAPPRRPWTEEHPVLFWGILGGVGIALALLIVSTVRAARPRGES